jgi:AraC family transcriptional regulator
MDGSLVGQIASYQIDHLSEAGMPDGIGGWRRAAVADVGPDFQASCAAVDFRPAGVIKRRTAVWSGLIGENVTATRHEVLESEYCGPAHLLIAYEQAGRHDGESIVDDIARSTRRDLACKLSYVPPGCRFREWQSPRVLMRATYLYIDAGLTDSEDGSGASRGVPRLFFDSPVLWQTARKLATLIETAPSTSRHYGEALAVVLAHELLSLNAGAPASPPPARGGLAGWQRRLIAQYVEDNLSGHISLASLADMARLSVYHFSRAFKQSFGKPPHRYHMSRRIERAKTLLANANLSVTEIAVDLGFSETSSFSATFRKLAGRTPTAYRRDLS